MLGDDKGREQKARYVRSQIQDPPPFRALFTVHSTLNKELIAANF